MHTQTTQEENRNTATEIAEGAHGVEFGGCLINGGNVQSANVPERSPPPFLHKIFKIADDQETKSIVSWNSDGTSFIIWDPNKFSENILPKYFKTNVFASFVYQLNTYGFRKIRGDRYEYANPWFQEGKKEWLKNIKRRDEKFQVTKKRDSSTLNRDVTNTARAQELQVLMAEQNNMKYQIQKLKESIGNMEHQITSMKSNMSDNEGSLTVLLKHLTETKDPAGKNDAKKPRLTGLKITESEVNNEDDIEISTPKVPSADNSGNSTQATKENAARFKDVERVLDDDAWCSIEGEGNLQVNHYKAIVELREMMESYRAIDWGNLEEKASDQGVDDYIPIDLWP